VRAVQAGPATGLMTQVPLLAALARTVGFSGAGQVVGVTCGVITDAALARGLFRYGPDRLWPADWVILARAPLAVGVAPRTADSFDQPSPATGRRASRSGRRRRPRAVPGGPSLRLGRLRSASVRGRS
jgi:hypothetical protein